MPLSCIDRPQTDPTPIFEFFRGNYATELLVAAVGHFKLFAHLASGPVASDDLRAQLGLEPRPFVVLTTALRAMGLLVRDAADGLDLSPVAREHLVPGGAFEVSDYLGLAAQSPGVVEMVERLRSNRPAGAKPGGAGAAFIYRDGIESAMETEASARHLTLALAGRAKNVAPLLAQQFPVDGAARVLDVGGGTGIYSIALLQKHPSLRAAVLDRAEVLKVAREMAQAYGVADRLELIPGDMFAGEIPGGYDVALLSNVLHDWDVPECERLIGRCAGAARRVAIHDVFLDDDLGGPLPLALYSAGLFAMTEGRAYSAGEYREMLGKSGLRAGGVIPTLIHCGLLIGERG